MINVQTSLTSEMVEIRCRMFPQNSPIGLLPTINKITEQIIARIFHEETEDLSDLFEKQFGFRHKHLTEQQVLRLVEYAESRLNRNEVMAYIFLDLASAFDRVSHEGVIYKMRQLG